MMLSNSFKFFIPIIKAYEKDGKKYVGGIASDTGLDKDQEKMSPEAIKKMSEYGNQRTLDLLSSHQADWEGSLGDVTKLEVVAQASSLSLHFEAELEDENPLAERLYKKLIKGRQYGISIGGRILEAEYQYDLEAKKHIRVFKDIELDHIAVTRKPANPRTWIAAIAKAWENYEKIKEVEKPEMTDEVGKREWDTTYINDLPDSAFAAIEPAYESGDTENKNARHLPHHDKDGKIDLPHLRNALARMNQIKPVTNSISADELRAKAEKHLIAHAKEYLPTSQWTQEEEKTTEGGRRTTKEVEQASSLLKQQEGLLKAKDKEIETLKKRVEELEAIPLPQKGVHPQVFSIAKDFALNSFQGEETEKIQKELDELLEQALKEADPKKREKIVERRLRLKEKLRGR